MPHSDEDRKRIQEVVHKVVHTATTLVGDFVSPDFGTSDVALLVHGYILAGAIDRMAEAMEKLADATKNSETNVSLDGVARDFISHQVSRFLEAEDR